MPAPSFTTTVRSVRDVAPEVREITLDAPETPLSFAPGQWISLQLPVGEHPPLVRAYSFAAPPSATGELVLCLDRVPEGLGSDYLFSLEPGAPIDCGAVLGNFVLPAEDRDLLWLAHFTGIVPFRAMLLHRRDQPPAGKVTLVQSGRTADDLVYRDEIRGLLPECPWLDVIEVVEEPASGWTGRIGSTLDHLPELVGERRDLIPMVCGKREFVRPIRDFFGELGFERRAVKWENYD